MEKYNLLISLLIATCNYAKDIHYNVKGSAFYGKHLFADLILDGLDEVIDDIRENILLGNGVEPLYSSKYLRAAAELVPPIAPDDRTNFVMMKGLVDRVRGMIKGMDAPSRGANSLLDSIGEHMDKMAGLLFLQVKEAPVHEGKGFTKEECEGCIERAIDRAKAELAKIDYEKVADQIIATSGQQQMLEGEEDTLDKLSKKLGV